MIHNYFKTLVLAFSLLALPEVVSAQQFQAKLSHYSTENGLTSNAISYISQDDYGYIWLATWNGLSRFDGYHFYNYQTGAGSHIPNLHNRIMSLAIDNEQNVWMRMYDGRVFVLKRSIDKIVNPFEGINGSDVFFTNNPLVVTSSGDVLVNIEEIGLYKMRMSKDKVETQLITTGDLKVTSMAEGYQNDIWLGTNKGVHRMDISNLTVERKGLFLDEEVTRLFSNGYNIYVGTFSGKILSFSYGQEPKVIRAEGKHPITSLFVDSHGIVWFSDRREGVCRMTPNSAEEKYYTQIVTVPDYDGHGAVFHEINGTVWMRMNRGGYGYYNRENDEVEYFHNDPTNPWNLSNTVNSALELNEGVIWESTSRRGLEKLEILKKTIDRFQLNPDEGPSPENEIRALVYDEKRQQLVFANKNGKLFLKRGNQDFNVISKDATGKPLGRVYGISIDKAGNYWLCSKGDGVYKFTPQNNGTGFNITQYRHSDNEWSLSDDRAYGCVEDSLGNLWIATYGGGVNLMTKSKNGQPVFYNYKNNMHKYPMSSHKKVRTVALDNDGNVWAGTTDGILIMSYKDKKLSIMPLKPSEQDPDHILMSNDVVCLAKDRHGSMWVGTNGGGLAHTIGKDSDGRWLFENFGSKDGLPSEEIRSITFDTRGNVWFATDHVICSYDVNKEIFTTFSELDGVDETWCSEGAAVCLPDGKIIFGTVNGYYVVDRAKLVTATGNVLKLRITDFWLNDELQSPRLNDNFDVYVPEARSIELPSHDALITFRFASLNYQLQHRVHYQYKLEGYDYTWYNADRLRTASYSNLPTGHYTFMVKAFLLESPDKYDMRQIELDVPPYFLLSKHAVWLYMAIIALLGIWLMFWHQRRLAQAEKIRLLREGPRESGQDMESDDFILFVNEYLDIHYANPMFSVDEFVLASEMSEDDFARKMQQSLGMSPREYVNEFRLKKAFVLLDTTNDSIAEIAFKCGFGNTATFNRHFKVKTGMLPSTYRDTHRNEGEEDRKTSD